MRDEAKLQMNAAGDSPPGHPQGRASRTAARPFGKVNHTPEGRRAGCLGWLGCAILLATAGCRSVDPLAPALQGDIPSGMTVGQVRERLGSPTYHEASPSGRVVDTYEALQTIFGRYGVREREEALEIRQFSVRYGADGRVDATFYHRGVLEGFTRLYSRSLGPEITPEQIAQVQPGRTTRADLERLFGPPTLARLAMDGGTRVEWIYDYRESGAVTPGGVFRSVEVLVDPAGIVTSAKTVDRVFPQWRR